MTRRSIEEIKARADEHSPTLSKIMTRSRVTRTPRCHRRCQSVKLAA